MTDEWKRNRLKYVAACNVRTLPEDTRADREFAYVDVSNVTQGKMTIPSEPVEFGAAPSRARRLAKPGDSIISTVRTYLRAVATVPDTAEDLVFSTAFAVLEPGDACDSRFLAWYLQGDEFVSRIESRSVGVSYPAITSTELMTMDLKLPPLRVQRAIADYLDRETAQIDTLIEEQQRLLALSAERATAVRDEMLDRLDWSVPLRTASVLIQTGPFGSQLKSSEYIPDGVPVINPSHLLDGRIEPSSDVAVSSVKAISLSRHQLVEDDLIVARRGELGRAAVVSADSAGFICGTGSALIRPRHDRLDTRFLALLFQTRRLREALLLSSVGSTMDNLNAEILGMLRIPVPPLGAQDEVRATIGNQLTRQSAVDEATRRIIELSRERRAALITAAVTGQINVGSAG